MFSTEITQYPVSFVAAPERLSCGKRFSNFCRDTIQGFFREKIYPTAVNSKLRDRMSLSSTENDRTLFKNFGGEHVIFQTSDGVRLEGFYFGVVAFKKAIVNRGGQFSQDKGQPIIKIFNTKLAIDFEHMKVDSNGKEDYSLEMAKEGIPRFQVYLDEQLEAPPVEKDAGVTIISGGNGFVFEYMRREMMTILLAGQSCFAFNIRGVGRSHGVLTENGTYRDIEAAYQYLTKVKGYANEMITTQGHCVIGGISTYLASKNPGVNLVLDRSFCRAPELLVNKIVPRSQSRTCASKINNWVSDSFSSLLGFLVVDYNNEERLPLVKGHVCLVEGQEEDYIPSGTTERLLERNPKATMIKLEVDHCSPWNKSGIKAYRQFLQKHHLLRNFGQTPELSLDKRLSFVSRNK